MSLVRTSFRESGDDEATYLTCDITEPAEYEIHNARTQREDEEHQRVEIALLGEFWAGVVEDVGESR